MKGLSPKQVIVTGLTLAVMLGGSVLYTSRQPVLAESPDNSAVQRQASTDLNLQYTQYKNDHSKKTRGHFHKQPIIEEAAALLGMDTSKLKAELKDKTLVEIAKEKGVSEADLIAKLNAVRGKKIDEAVQSGKLDAEKAEKIKSRMTKHIQFMVNHKQSDFSGKYGIKHKAMMPAADKLSALLGITEDELNAQLKQGKSLTEIAQAKGISKDQLIGKIKEEMTPWIEKMVDHKRDKSSDKK